MNFLGFALLMALLIAVQLATFTWAAQNLTKTPGKDYDEQGKHLGEQPLHRRVLGCKLTDFSLGRREPYLPVPNGNTFSICQGNHFATFYDNDWGIARYAVYKITAEQATAARVERIGDPWQPTQIIGKSILQGSDDLFKKQPNKREYDRGHIVPFYILAYSRDSARSTFTYTNCVPQNANFNRGQWGKYEKKIDSYSLNGCSEEGDTLYLITGTSPVKFGEKLKFQGGITGVDTSFQQMKKFHDNVGFFQREIAIPNSMWTVGCCWNDKRREVVGAFGVMGTNSLNKPLNEFMMGKQSVEYVERVLQLEYLLKIQLFPWPDAKDCYAPEKNVNLDDFPGR